MEQKIEKLSLSSMTALTNVVDVLQKDKYQVSHNQSEVISTIVHLITTSYKVPYIRFNEYTEVPVIVDGDTFFYIMGVRCNTNNKMEVFLRGENAVDTDNTLTEDMQKESKWMNLTSSDINVINWPHFANCLFSAYQELDFKFDKQE